MTADATGPASEAMRGRRSRAPFELLRFSAGPVPGGLVVVELECRFASGTGRFTRQPVLVVEVGADRPRLELAPVRATLDDGRWRAAYAIPSESYDDASFALGHRGTLLDLPAPDEPTDGDRLTALAREANTLRRRLEAAEAEAAASAAELGAAVSAVRDEAADHISTLEHDHATITQAAQASADERLHAATAEAEARAEAAESRALAAEASVEERLHAAIAEAEARAEAAEASTDERVREATAEAEARAESAESRALSAEASADERVRVAAEASVEERVGAATAEAEARAEAAEARALAAEEGIVVLRAELAEERARSQVALAPSDDDDTQALAAVAQADDDTQALAALAQADDDATRPLTVSAEPRGNREPVPPALARRRPATQRSAGAWIAVAALALFAFVLLGLLLGFLA